MLQTHDQSVREGSGVDAKRAVPYPARETNLNQMHGPVAAAGPDYSIVTVPAIPLALSVAAVSLPMVYAYLPGVEKQRLAYSLLCTVATTRKSGSDDPNR